MIRSMTGFGTADSVRDDWGIRAEVRSVNRKELQVTFSLPDAFRLKEVELQKLVEERVHRGHVYFSLEVEPREAGAPMLVDEQRVAGYLRILQELAAERDIACNVEMASLLRLPGGLKEEVVDEELRDALWEDVVQTAARAVDALVEMRRTEGENLSGQLEGFCEQIAELTDSIEQAQGDFVPDYRDRLVERINGLLEGTGVTVNDDSIAREVAMYADRADVSEEIARLRSHVEQFREALSGPDDPVGRKMEFIGQEMLREASTIASKVPAGRQVDDVLELKTVVERLREQVRNVE
ncbi:MAG: YicC/YloC family endoribonuclease [Candidatus Brocadiia bacterium]